jgi:hypothetical protein
LSYRSFKEAVLRNAKWQCEVPGCDATAETVHHFLKRSTWPRYAEDPDDGMACCGRCHSEIERREREGGDILEMYPSARYRSMCEKAGLIGKPI